MKRKYTAAALSLNQLPMDWQGNLRRMREGLESARAQGASLLLMPEMVFSAYGCEDVFLHDWMYEEVENQVKEFEALTFGMIVTAGFPVKFQGKRYNGAGLFVDGSLRGIYLKRHLANDGLHYEARWFTPWPAGVQQHMSYAGRDIPVGDVAFFVGGLAIGFEICEDAWVAHEKGNQQEVLTQCRPHLVLNPSASHFSLRKQEKRRQIIAGGSQRHSADYLYCNLNGNEAGRVIYDGSVLLARQGKIVYEGERFFLGEQRLHLMPLDFQPQEAEESSQWFTVDFQWETACEKGMPRSAAELNEEEEFLLVETLGLMDYMRKSWSRGFILSLSGGVDSATCAALVYYMALRIEKELTAEEFQKLFGWMNLPGQKAEQMMPHLLHCVYQATENSGPVTQNAAQKLAEAVDANYYFYDVQPLLDGYHQLTSKALQRPLNWEKDDLALQNIQARVRAPGVWMLANITGGLLLTTSNRSEAAVGYATMDGDTSGGLSPLAGIGKPFLQEWLRSVEKKSLCGFKALKALSFVNEQQPTAELRPQERTQTDEEDLMPYPVLDRIQKLAIRDRLSPQQILNTLREEDTASRQQCIIWLKKFFNLWARNQWKRERYAPAFHLDDESLDPKTWCRFPILSAGYRELLERLQ